MKRFRFIDAWRSSPAAGAPNDREVVAASGLFDPAFYLATSLDVAAAGLDPLDHFCTDGWREGRRPNLYFDPVWYAAAYDLPRDADGVARRNPLLHYIDEGEARGLRPVASFDPAWFRRVAAISAGTSPLAHLLARRGADGLGPEELSDFEAWDARGAVAVTGLFDANFYLIANPDVRELGRDPFLHFHAHGWREGRRPNPYFDPLWYAARHLADGGAVNPLVHYVRGGEASGCDPSCLFEAAWYRRTYDVPHDRLALAHFLEHRRSQRVAPNSHFDLAFYLARHGEEMGPNRDPFAHLLRWGATRDLDPSPVFDSQAYRRDAAARGLDLEQEVPLVHFLATRSRGEAA